MPERRAKATHAISFNQVASNIPRLLAVVRMPIAKMFEQLS